MRVAIDVPGQVLGLSPNARAAGFKRRERDGIDARRRAAGLALCPRWSSSFVSSGVERVRETLDWRIGVEARRASRHVVPSGVSERPPTMRSMPCHCGVED